jgi:hypothetical protein
MFSQDIYNAPVLSVCFTVLMEAIKVGCMMMRFYVFLIGIYPEEVISIIKLFSVSICLSILHMIQG